MEKFRRRFPSTKELVTDVSILNTHSPNLQIAPNSARWISPAKRAAYSSVQVASNPKAYKVTPGSHVKVYDMTSQTIKLTNTSQEFDPSHLLTSTNEFNADKKQRSNEKSKTSIPSFADHKEKLLKSQQLRLLRKQDSEASFFGARKPHLTPMQEKAIPNGNRTLTRFIDKLILKGSLPTEASEFFSPTHKNPSKSHIRLDPIPKKETKSISKIPDDENTPGHNIIPEWMKGISDFQEKYTKTKIKSKYPIPEILKKDPNEREDLELNFVVKWLEKIDLFNKFPYDLLVGLGQRLKIVHLQEGDILCNIGESADCLYIIYDGAIDGYIPDKEGEKLILTAKAGELLGRQSMETIGKRTAKLVAAKPTYIVLLYRMDYQEVSGEIKSLIRPTQAIYDFVMKHSLLGQFSELRKMAFMNHLEFKKVYKNDVIYSVGDPAQSFYFIMSGDIIRQVPVTIEKSNKWPTSKNSWKMYKKVLTYSIKMPLEQGEVFGMSEFLNNIPRKEKLIAEGEAMVLICSKSVFYESKKV